VWADQRRPGPGELVVCRPVAVGGGVCGPGRGQPDPGVLGAGHQASAITPIVMLLGVTARAGGRWPRPGRGERRCPPPTPRQLAAVARPSAAGQGPERPHRGACRRGWWSWWPTAQRAPRRRGQQHDVVKLRVELPLIRRASAQEQHLDVVGRQQVLDAVLSPDPVLPGSQAGWLVQGGAGSSTEQARRRSTWLPSPPREPTAT
jgi:hypothetical protein